MLVITDGEPIPSTVRGGTVAIGNFDGIHRGHQALIGRALERARPAMGARGHPCGALLFEPHPREYFVPDETHFRLTPLTEKLRILDRDLSLDFARVLTFDATLSHMSAEDFITRILVAELGIAGAVVGYDFYFGHKRQGSPAMLTDAGRHHGFTVDIIAPVADRGDVLSSTAVRLKLAEGDIAGANAILGRPWRVTGPVIGGAKRGTGMGYPTANIPMPKGTALAHGIFAVRLEIDADGQRGVWHDGAAYLGTRPTFDDGMPVLEVFVLDFDGDLYGRTVAVELISFIRPDRKFDGAAELVEQMDKDVAQVRRVLAGV